MADNDELKVARLSNNSAGSLIDNSLANLETALATIFGITQDSDCENAMTISSDGDITMIGMLTLAADPATDLQIATKQYVDNNSSTAASVQAQLNMTADQAVTAGSTDAIAWDAAEIEVGGDCWAAGAPTRLVVPDGGSYFIQGNIHIKSSAVDEECLSYATIKKNGTIIVEGLWAILRAESAGFEIGNTYGGSIEFCFLEPCDADDYFEVFITAVTNNHTIVDDYTRFGLLKVG